MALRIGVNALYLLPGGVGGTEIYLRCLLAALAEIDADNQYFIFTNRETDSSNPGRADARGSAGYRAAPVRAADASLVPQHPNFHTVRQRVTASFRPARILWEQTVLPLAAAKLEIDVMWNPGFTAPFYCPCPQVTVFHDMQHRRHPEYFRWFDLPFWRFLLSGSAHLSTYLIAVSEPTRADVLSHYRLPEWKVRTVWSGVDPRFFDLAALRRLEPFLLTVSTLHPHKNLDRLLRAFADFREGCPEYRLVVCGLHGFFTEQLHRLRDSLGLSDAVDFPGWIPREDLLDLFARASAFVYPSLFEGFGLPVLEALAAGVPAACSGVEPLATIAGGAALQFDPDDEKSIADAMRRLVSDDALRERLKAAGPLRARAFSWRAAALGTLEILTAAAGLTTPVGAVSLKNS
jgi:glycosyltransferase involved in cell wall biosynthesis